MNTRYDEEGNDIWKGAFTSPIARADSNGNVVFSMGMVVWELLVGGFSSVLNCSMLLGLFLGNGDR